MPVTVLVPLLALRKSRTPHVNESESIPLANWETTDPRWTEYAYLVDVVMIPLWTDIPHDPRVYLSHSRVRFLRTAIAGIILLLLLRTCPIYFSFVCVSACLLVCVPASLIVCSRTELYLPRYPARVAPVLVPVR